METSLTQTLKTRLQTYRLLYYSPEPETGERVCIALLFGDGGRYSVLFDEHFPKLRCLAPGAETSLLGFYLQDIERQLERNAVADAGPVLRTYGPQFQASEPREVLAPLTQTLKLRLLERFVRHGGKGATADAKTEEATALEQSVNDSLRNYVFGLRPPPNVEVFRNASVQQLFHIDQKIRPVAMAFRSGATTVIVDGVDVKLLTAGKAVKRTNEIVHTFWQYQRLRKTHVAIGEIKRVALVLNGLKHESRRIAEAHDYALDQLKKEAELVVDQRSGSGTSELERSLAAIGG